MTTIKPNKNLAYLIQNHISRIRCQPQVSNYFNIYFRVKLSLEISINIDVIMQKNDTTPHSNREYIRPTKTIPIVIYCTTDLKHKPIALRNGNEIFIA